MTRRMLLTFFVFATVTVWVAPLSAADATPDTYGCIILIDGLRGDMARKYAEEGLMPNVKKYFLDGGVWANKATTVFPSITGAAIPSIVTGAYPGRHNLPSLYFFERSEMKYYVLYTVKGSWQFNRLIDTTRTKTIFEYFPEKDDTWAIGLHVNRGADKVIPVAFNVGYKPLAWAAKLTEFWRGIKRAFTGGKPARLTVVYNGWFDHVEHGFGADAEGLKPHYKSVDDQIGQCIDTYKKLGIFDKTYFALVSDHGQSSFDTSVNIWDYIKGTHDIPIVENIWKKIPLIPLDWDVENPDDYRKYVMVVPAGQAHALLYFAKPGQGEGDNDWTERPSFEQLLSYPIHGHAVNVIDEVRNQDAVDFALVKHRPSGIVHVFGKGSAEATIERADGTDGHLFRYTVADGNADPLGFVDNPATAALVNHDGSAGPDQMFFTDREWQLATNRTDYLDAVAQLFQIFDSERAPDVFISGALGYNLIGSTYDGEVSRHGAINQFESHSTFALIGPGIRQQTIQTARSVDAVPTMLHCLQVPFDPAMHDGEVIEPVRNAIMGSSEKGSDRKVLDDFLGQIRKLSELSAIVERMQNIGCSSQADMERLVDVQASYADLLAMVESRSMAIINDYRAQSAGDGGTAVQGLCRFLRSLDGDGKALMAPFVKELARALDHDSAASLRACLD